MLIVLTLNLITTYLISSTFENFFIFFIIFFSLIVLNSEILSIFQGFNSTNILIFSMIELVLTTIIFLKSKKKLIKIERFTPKINFKKEKMLFIFALCFLFMLISFFIISLMSPPLEPDSRMYHFVRIFEYVNKGTFAHFPTNEARNIVMPINSEIFYSYFYVFKKEDTGFYLFSYFSYLFLAVGIYKILRLLNFSVKESFYTVLTFSSFGIVLVQIPSLQTDIVVSAFIVASIALFMLAHTRKSNSLIYFSALSYSLALGVKTTAFIVFPAYLIIIFAYIFLNKIDFKKTLLLFSFLILNTIIFSSYNYILNYLDFNNFFSNKMLSLEHSQKLNFYNIAQNLVYLFSDFLGFKNGILKVFSDNLESSLLSLLNIQSARVDNIVTFDERMVGFSFGGIFLFVPCLIVSFFKALKLRTKESLLILAFSSTFLINFLLTAAIFPYSPFIIRYFLLFFALSAFSLVYSYNNSFIRNLVIVLCSFNLLIYSIFSTRFPLHFLFKENLFNLRNLNEKVLLTKQKDKFIRFQYVFSKAFIENFKKSDNIGILNDDGFYEIIKLKNSGYKISVLKAKDFKKSTLSQFDYLLLINKKNSYRQDNNNFKIEEIEEDKKNNTADFYCSYNKNRLLEEKTPFVQFCTFNENFLNKRNFKLQKYFEIYNNRVDIYSKS